ELAKYVPRFLQRRFGVDRRPEELHASLEVGVGALPLGEARGRQHDRCVLVLWPRKVIPCRVELDARGYAGSGREAPAEQRLDPIERIPPGDADLEGPAFVGAAVEGHELCSDLACQLAA